MTKSITVMATRPGVYGHYRETGDVFEVEHDRHFSATWMKKVSASQAKKLHEAETEFEQAELHVVDTSSENNPELERLRAELLAKDKELAELRQSAPKQTKPKTEVKPSEPPKTAAEVLAMANDPNVQFMAFKSEAAKVLGDATPSTKAEIVAALEDKATQP